MGNFRNGVAQEGGRAYGTKPRDIFEVFFALKTCIRQSAAPEHHVSGAVRQQAAQLRAKAFLRPAEFRRIRKREVKSVHAIVHAGIDGFLRPAQQCRFKGIIVNLFRTLRL